MRLQAVSDMEPHARMAAPTVTVAGVSAVGVHALESRRPQVPVGGERSAIAGSDEPRDLPGSHSQERTQAFGGAVVTARGRVVLAALLACAAVLIAAAGVPLSGATLLALVLILVALDVVAPVLFPAPSPRILLEEACDLIDAERRAS